MPYANADQQRAAAKRRAQQRLAKFALVASHVENVNFNDVQGNIIGHVPGTLTITDDGDECTILQRFPITTHHKYADIHKLEAEGQSLVDESRNQSLLPRPPRPLENTSNEGQICQIGLWRQRGEIDWTSDHLKNTQFSNKILEWVQRLFRDHVHFRAQQLRSDLYEALQSRKAGFDLLAKEHNTNYLHRWNTMAILVQGDTSIAHMDSDDAFPCIFVNLGGATQLVLSRQDCSVIVNLAEGDVVFLGSRQYSYATINGHKG